MQNDRDVLNAMLTAARRIESKSEGLTYEQFKDNDDLLDICAMQYQIIGNSSDSLSVAFQQRYSEVDWDGMYGLRCAIAHAYGTSNFSKLKLWNSIKKDVPELIRSLEAIIDNLDDEAPL